MSDVDKLLGLTGRDGHVSVCYQHHADRGTFTADVVAVRDAQAVVDSLPPDMDVWVSSALVDPSRISTGKRGTQRDVRALLWLPTDIDVKPGGMPDWSSAYGLTETLAVALNCEPVLVKSGHGLQPRWITDPTDADWSCDGPDDPRWLDLVALSRRWQRLVQHYAEARGGHVDNVSDLSRVLRAPGTLNYKDPAAPVAVEVEGWGTGDVIGVDDVVRALELTGIPEYPEDRDALGEIVSAAGEWAWSDSTCSYVQAMVFGWATDKPKSGRHPWLVAQATRLAAAHRAGCITEADYDAAVTVLGKAFARIVADPAIDKPRKVTPGEVSDALSWGVAKVETHDNAKVAHELGDHRHAGDDTEPAGLEDVVFTATPELAYIRALARERMVSPWALLGTMLSLVIATTDPTVRIPGFIGTRASLNLGVALASASGGGKSTTMAVAWEALERALSRYRVDQRNPSSGEGILTLFVDTDNKGVQEQIRSRCVSIIDEVATLVGQANRSGSTLMSTLRTALSGGPLDNHGAEKSRRRHLEPHSYRYCIVIGVQRRTAMHFLDDDDAGTPQRFLWMPATDRNADPDAPAAGDNVFANWQMRVHGDTVLYPDHVAGEVREAHAARVRGDGHALDGHAMLTRLKVAAGLALLHGGVVVSEQLWDLSGHVMTVSDRTRDALLDYAQAERVEAAQARGRAAAVTEDAKAEAAVERCVLVIARKVHRSARPMTRAEVKAASGRHRAVWREALDLAVERGLVTAVPIEGQGQTGHTYVPGAVKP